MKKILKSSLRNSFIAISILTIAFMEGKSFGQAINPSPVDEVNPYMGNISHMLVPAYPTIHLPNSQLRVYPEREDYTSDLIFGLPIIITSHRGSSAFKLSPFQGKESDINHVESYSYDQEEITPYRYQVYLDEKEIHVDFAPSHQSAVYEFTFEKNESPHLIWYSNKGELNYKDNAVYGYQWIDGKTKIYLYAITNQPAESWATLSDRKWNKQETQASGNNATIVLTYPASTKKIQVSYGISFIDVEQARKNLEREIASKSIHKIAEQGKKIWNETLNKIQITGGTPDERTVFYTSMYRCYERPINLSEDGRYYSAFDGKVHNDEGRPFYTDNWIWDTYRATHPLRVLIDPERESDIIHSFIRMSEQMDNFWLPTFPEVTGDSRRMNSNHGIATIIDAYRKGIRDFDLEKAYLASRNAIEEKTLIPWSAAPAGWLDDFYKKKGYIPALNHNEQETVADVNPFEKRQPVAVTLGTAYDQWCLSQIAEELGKEEDATHYLSCSYNYRNLFHPETRFFHPKDKDGKFLDNIDYRTSGGQGAREYYGENNGYIYRWDVQHNIADLIALNGGNDHFIKELDSMFQTSLGESKWTFFNKLPDHTGNVGQFSMANEPCLHIPYLYNYAGQPWKTQKRIRTLINQWFRNDILGIPGDEDGGGMSAFVVFSQLGFYPVTPGSPTYNIGSPFFSEMKMNLGNGKNFMIKAVNASSKNKYIQSAKLNGKPLNQAWFSHKDIHEGAILELEMGPKANKTWGISNPPPSAKPHP